VSPSGNLTRFSTSNPSLNDVEHLDVGDAIEGWRLCRFVTDVTGEFFQDLDAGREDEGPGVTTYVQPNGPHTFPFTVHTEFSGLRVTQFFSRNTSAKTVTVKMRVLNLAGVATKPILLERVMDVDEGGAPTDDVAVAGKHFAFVSGGDATRGIMLTADTMSIRHAGTQQASGAERFGGEEFWPCQNGNIGLGTWPAGPLWDWSIAMTYYLGSIKAGSSKTVSFTYRAF
jgi:hypothetical protein